MADKRVPKADPQPLKIFTKGELQGLAGQHLGRNCVSCIYGSDQTKNQHSFEATLAKSLWREHDLVLNAWGKIIGHDQLKKRTYRLIQALLRRTRKEAGEFRCYPINPDAPLR